jgi:phage terminase large subunit-like protein
LDGGAAAGSFIQPLREAGIDVLDIGVKKHAQACGALYDGARDGGIVHLGDPLLETALRGAATRVMGDAWLWKRRTSTSDITPLVAATIALWAHAEADEGVALWVSYA